MECAIALVFVPLVITFIYAVMKKPAGTPVARDKVDTLVEFLQHVNARLGERDAQAVRGVAWEIYDGQLRDEIQRRLREQPTPPVAP